MSDLIIKPSGTSANFKVQNPSGTNKITMDSDGVTTFASNVALSGTMTTGTLGSGVTFPADHIIDKGQALLGQDGYISVHNSQPTGFGYIVGPVTLKNNDWIHVFVNGGMVYGNQNNNEKIAYIGVNYKINSTFSSASDGNFEQRFFYKASGDTGTNDDDYVTPTFIFYYQNTSGSNENFYYRVAHTTADSTTTWNYNSSYSYIKTLYYVIQG